MPRILVVDDLPEICDLVNEILSWEGFSVATATGAGEARRLLGTMRFDLVIVDVILPDEGGLPLAEFAASTGAKIMLMSGSTRVLQSAKRLPWPVVAKPFRIEAFATSVRAILDPGTH